MLATIALGEVNNLVFGLLVTVVATIDMKARTVEVRIGGTEVQTLGGGHRQETVEFRHPIVIKGIQGPPEGIIVELFGGNAWGNETVGGLILEEPRDQIECLIDKPQTVEHHRLDRLAHGEVSHFRVLVGGLINDVPKAKFVEHASDKAEVVQDLATIGGLVGHHNLLS